MVEIISENLKVHLGADLFVDDIRQAVKDVAKRDYPELDLDKIPPIIVPQFFLAQNPEAIHYEKYIEELKNLKGEIDVNEDNQLKENLMHFEGELERLKVLKRVKQLEHVIGECAEKKVYNFLKDCIRNTEVLVVNNFKIMELKDLDEIGQEFEKDFFILNLTKRYILSLEVKANCNDKSLKSAWSQAENCKDLINKWVGSDLSEENGWSFFCVAYFQRNPDNFTFCDNCAKYIILGDEFKDKFEKMTSDIPTPPVGTDTKAREEFKNVATNLLFFASSEPVATPRRITEEIVKYPYCFCIHLGTYALKQSDLALGASVDRGGQESLCI